jgi:hypothetical protein
VVRVARTRGVCGAENHEFKRRNNRYMYAECALGSADAAGITWAFRWADSPTQSVSRSDCLTIGAASRRAPHNAGFLCFLGLVGTAIDLAVSQGNRDRENLSKASEDDPKIFFKFPSFDGLKSCDRVGY